MFKERHDWCILEWQNMGYEVKHTTFQEEWKHDVFFVPAKSENPDADSSISRSQNLFP
jgi:hypothetical protein